MRLAQQGISKVICMGKATPLGDGGSDTAHAKALPVTRMQMPVMFNSKIEKAVFVIDLEDYCKTFLYCLWCFAKRIGQRGQGH